MEAEQQEPDGWSHGFLVSCDGNCVNDGFVSSPSTITTVVSRYRYRSNKYNEENWKKMGAALSESNKLIELHLGNLSKKAAATLFSGEINYTWPSLKFLTLGGNLGLGGMRTVCSALKLTSKLDKLDLGVTKLGVGVAKLLVDMLNHIRIKHLRLQSGANIKYNDKELENLLSAKNARRLVRLRIGGVDLTARGYETISRFLQREDILLEGLDVPVDTDCSAKLLIDSIPHQSKLEDIKLPRVENVEDALLDLVCNTSSLEALRNSNHRLANVGSLRTFNIKAGSTGEKLLEALLINMQVENGAPIPFAIRRKVRRFYLKNPDFVVSVFNDMDVALMPHVLELVTKAESPEDSKAYTREGLFQCVACSDDLDGTYRLLKNCHVSELFSFPSPEAQMRQKDRIIQQLEGANEDLKAENKRLKQKIDRLTAEKEERGRADSSPPDKRAKTTDIES